MQSNNENFSALKMKGSQKELELKFNSVQKLKKKTDELRNETYAIISEDDLED